MNLLFNLNFGFPIGAMAGGNSMMINMTPERYRNLYSIYQGKGEWIRNIRERITETLSLLHSIGRVPMDVVMW